MNIGIITQWYPSGAGNVSKSYYNSLIKEHNVFIYSRGGPNLLNNDEWNQDYVTIAPKHSQLTGIHKRHFRKWVKANLISVVIFNEQRHWGSVLFAKKLNLLTGAYIDYYKQDTVDLFNSYDFLLCNTQRHFNVFKSHKQAVYIPWGTTKQSFNSKKLLSNKIRFLLLSNQGLAFLENAPWLDRTNTEIAVRAFQKVNGNCELIILSQVELSKTPTYFQQLINNDSRINFISERYNEFPFEKGDVYVYPSRLDGIGLTLLEALSFGIPCITTDCQPMNEFVIDGFNGKLIIVDKLYGRPDGYYWPESIINIDNLTSIMQFYVDNPDQIITHSRNAINYINDYRDWNKNASELPSLINKFKKYNLKTGIEKRMFNQDLLDNPSPFQMIIIAFKRMIKSLKR
jgi:1,2-diacylglycerol 3-alpha-glucosyltransferase